MTVVALRETPRRDTRKPRTAPEPPFECGHRGVAVWYEPEKWSADWNWDPCSQWQCPRCGRCLGPEMVYEDGLPMFTEEEYAAISRGETFTDEELARKPGERRAAMDKPG